MYKSPIVKVVNSLAHEAIISASAEGARDLLRERDILPKEETIVKIEEKTVEVTRTTSDL